MSRVLRNRNAPVLTKRTVSASTSKSLYRTVATTEVRYENGKTVSKQESDKKTLERWVAYPQDIQRVINLQEELECVSERARKEQASEREVTPFTDDGGSDDILSNTYHKGGEEATAMTSSTSLKIPPFGGTPGENLNSFFRRFDRAVRRVVYPPYPAGEEGERLNEMGMTLMMQDNLVGKSLEKSDAFPNAAYKSVQVFEDALRQAFAQ